MENNKIPGISVVVFVVEFVTMSKSKVFKVELGFYVINAVQSDIGQLPQQKSIDQKDSHDSVKVRKVLNYGLPTCTSKSLNEVTVS